VAGRHRVERAKPAAFRRGLLMYTEDRGAALLAAVGEIAPGNWIGPTRGPKSDLAMTRYSPLREGRAYWPGSRCSSPVGRPSCSLAI
jgi:hypothetical protein